MKDVPTVPIGGYVGSALASSVESGAISSATAGAISGAVGGAAAGATAGGLNAAYYGGNIGEAMLKGAAGGALGGLAGSGLGYGLGGLPDPLRYAGQVLGGGLIGGGLQELFGGHFSDGFMNGAIGAAVSFVIYEAAKNSNAKSSLADQYKSEAERNMVVNKDSCGERQEFNDLPESTPQMHAGGFIHFLSKPPINPWEPGVGTEGPWFAPWRQILPPAPRPDPQPWWFEWKHMDPPHPVPPHEEYVPIALLDGNLRCG